MNVFVRVCVCVCQIFYNVIFFSLPFDLRLYSNRVVSVLRINSNCNFEEIFK